MVNIKFTKKLCNFVILCSLQDLNTKRKGKLRTASVAVDVTSYFKVEMDQ